MIEPETKDIPPDALAQKLINYNISKLDEIERRGIQIERLSSALHAFCNNTDVQKCLTEATHVKIVNLLFELIIMSLQDHAKIVKLGQSAPCNACYTYPDTVTR